MQMSDDEKLMLFLIRWRMELDLDISELENGNTLSDAVILGWINGNNKFQKFLSEANEAKEEFEFWVSDRVAKLIKNRELTIGTLERLETDLFKNKIKITIED